MERLSNGVRRRMDGKGDRWAAEHRVHLGNDFFMQDIDACFGFMAFGNNSGERLFLEYVPDTYANRNNAIRRFAVVAMFDRKRNLEAADARSNTVSKSFYLYLCRTIGEAQPLFPRFYYVIGGDRPPWTLYEVDLETGCRDREPAAEVDSTQWRCLWDTLGLSDARQQLEKWTGKSA